MARVTRAEAARSLAARREHDKGDGNFPSPRPGAPIADERPRDRRPRDVPKERDDRTAPKLSGDSKGQRARNPRLAVRGEPRAKR